MDIDLDGLISTEAANSAKGSKKFQPKGKSKLKPKPKPELINNIDASTNSECIAELDPLTGEEVVILNDNIDFQVVNLSPGSKIQEAENSLLKEPLNALARSITGSGQSHKMEQIANKPDQDVEPVQHGENTRSDLSKTVFMENEPIPSCTPDEILGTSSPRTTSSFPTKTISDYHVNEEPIDLTEFSVMNHGPGPSDTSHTQPRRGTRIKRKPNTSERLTRLENNDDHVSENESLTQKKESNKRKKVEEVVDELNEVQKKKFSHSTRRNRRPGNHELLKISEEDYELHMHKYSLKDLIRRREHNERIAKKEASLLRTDTADQSDQAQNATYYNYRTHMKIRPRMRWTTQLTELFNKAIELFGADLSIINECFPGCTREQIRSKFKREEKRQRIRIESALNSRAEGLSHFEFVIELLKQIQAQDSENDDSVSLTGEEDDVINEGGNVDLQKEAEDMEPNVPAAAESPTESVIIKDDIWSQYKSEI